MSESKVFFWWCSGMISISRLYSLWASLMKALMQWMYESISMSRTSSLPEKTSNRKTFVERAADLSTKQEIHHPRSW